MNPFDRMVLAYATGDYFATQYQAPRVVGQAQSQPDTSKPPEPQTPVSVELYFESIKVHYPYLYPFVQQHKTAVKKKPEPKKSPHRRKFKGVDESTAQKKRQIIESVPTAYATTTNNVPAVVNIRVPRVVDDKILTVIRKEVPTLVVKEEPTTKTQQVEKIVESPNREKIMEPPRVINPGVILYNNPTKNEPMQVTPFDLTRGRALSASVHLLDNLKEIFLPRVTVKTMFKNNPRIKSKILHCLRRWIARTKMKTQ
jgi:hypothetical protein